MTGKFRAVLFDLDGVLAPTATLHQEAWRLLFSGYFAAHNVIPSYSDEDYYRYIDGRPRFQGVVAMLESRQIVLPFGNPTDSPDAQTVCGLGNAKNVFFQGLLAKGIAPYPEVAEAIDVLVNHGIKVAVVTSSRNGAKVLSQTGLEGKFATVVDGTVVADRRLKGKPSPDAFLLAASLLGVPSEKAVVVEDALSGVAAGVAGGFGLTVGVDRGEVGAAALREAGADVVIASLQDLSQLILGATASDPVDRTRFPADPWRMIEVETADRRADRLSATLFSLSNGYLGVRGVGDGFRGFGFGTLINGFHETFPIGHAEDAYGFARVGQFLQGVPDVVGFRVVVDGVRLDEASFESGRTELDFRVGVSTGIRVWRLPNGNRVQVRQRRIVPLFERHVAAIEVTVSPLDADAAVLVSFEVDARNAQNIEPEGFSDPRGSESAKGGGLDVYYSASGVSGRCHNSQLSFAGGWKDIFPNEAQVHKGESVSYVRYVAYHSDDVVPEGVRKGLLTVHEGDLAKLETAAFEDAERVSKVGFDQLAREQRAWLDDFWDRADVQVQGPGAGVQQAIRWSLFQLAQVSAKLVGGIAAKGVSGVGYSGHCFWDTEIFVLPFLIYVCPEAARLVLEHRYAMLPAARRRARTMSLRGALFPWRTINGEEASAYYPAGTAQYHIDADVAYAVIQYVLVTGDWKFLQECGIDILVETAKMWADLGFTGQDGKFHIHQVTGPDEYSAVVDDNFYTNAMARFCLDQTATLWESLPKEVRESKRQQLSVGDDEPSRWRSIADAMTILWDEDLGVHPQDAMFLSREPWVFDDDSTPLLLRYHPLVIYRHKVLKQADVVLALQLLSGLFSFEEKKADFEYYDPLTTGDSTLSASSQCIIAAEVGDLDKALHYFEDSLYTDLADLHENAEMGIHVAAAGGAWQCLVNGFGGLRDLTGGIPRLNPHLPPSWQSLAFSLMIAGTKLRVKVLPDEVRLSWVSGPGVALEVCGMRLSLGESHFEEVVPLKASRSRPI